MYIPFSSRPAMLGLRQWPFPSVRLPVISLLFLSAIALRAEPLLPPLLEGDVLFHTSSSAQSRPIQLATHAKYTHVGILLNLNGTLEVLEAVQPVRITPVDTWRRSGKNFVVKRLKDRNRILNSSTVEAMRRVGRTFLGRSYDTAFGWSDDRLYCSELVWKIYERATGLRLGNPRPLGDFDLTAPEVQRQLRLRYGNRIPMSEPVLSPGDMFASPLLVTIHAD